MQFEELNIGEEGLTICQKWNEKYKKGQLSSLDFYRHWKFWVSKICMHNKGEDGIIWSSNEELMKATVYDPLMQFICGGDPKVVLAEAFAESKLTSVCSKAFKVGELIYKCRECAVNKTSALCNYCFKNSEHRNHKHKIGASLGGECCDCGDVEAWTQNPYCKAHVARMGSTNQDALSDDIKERARIAFEAVVWYAYRVLNIEDLSHTQFKNLSDEPCNINMYCTVLYNNCDETFYLLPSRLVRVLKCSERQRIAYSTNIYFKGREVVKCSDYQHCNKLKREIEMYMPDENKRELLRVRVAHVIIIYHQLFSMRLLTWLERFLSIEACFRKIFADVVLRAQGEDPCIIKGISLKDSVLWKNARIHWHRLFKSAMLREYDTKKRLAQEFTKYYDHVLGYFIWNDYDYSYSIASLPIQLFTSSSIAHCLLAHNDIFVVLLNIFISKGLPERNTAGRLEYEKNPIFCKLHKRGLHILDHLSYLLNSVPTLWTDDLRKNFLRRLDCFYQLLVMMQGMAPMNKQNEWRSIYKRDWESPFDLQESLSSCICLALKWCGSDRDVLIQAYRALLQCLAENSSFDRSKPCEVRDLLNYRTLCLHYDVSTKPVSIHLPLTRFLVGLHLHLEKFKLKFDGTEFQGFYKPIPEVIIEPILRIQVLESQIHAGMWNEHRFDLLKQFSLYQSVQCRTEMYDRDITGLQIGASLIENNRFLIHCLNKYKLIDLAYADFETRSLELPEDKIKQTIILVEKFLQLLIVIIGERYMPGLSNISSDERVKKELIQHLCVKPLLHSELVQIIPDELSSGTSVEDFIKELAEFKQEPQSMAERVYELKNEYYEQYNVFYYHYTNEELLKAKENQIKRRAAAGQLKCCPPPQLPKLNDPFATIVNLLQCDVMLHIMHTVLRQCLNAQARSFSELQLQQVLHLIGYALQEEQTNNYPFFKFIENSKKLYIFQHLEALLICPRADAQKDLLKWVINEFQKATNQLEALSKNVSEDKTKNEKERRAKIAAKRKTELMERMRAMQANFMKNNAALSEEENSEIPLVNKSSHFESTMDLTEENKQLVALGNNQSIRTSTEKSYTCIVCRKEEIVRLDGPSMVLAAFVQESTVLSQNRYMEKLKKSLHTTMYLHANLSPAPHITTCGHAMHANCWEQYRNSPVDWRPYRLLYTENFVDEQEYLCPFCECLSNTVLPIVPSLSVLQSESAKTELNFGDFIKCLKIIFSKKTIKCHGDRDPNIPCKYDHCKACMKLNPINTCEAQWIKLPHRQFYWLDFKEACTDLSKSFTSLFSNKGLKLQSDFVRLVESFTIAPFSKGLHLDPNFVRKINSDGRINPFTWKSLACMVHSTEIFLRDSNKPLLGQLSSRQREGIESFVKLGAILGCSSKSIVNKCYALSFIEILLGYHDKAPSILEWDSLGFLIALTMSLPSLSNQISDRYNKVLPVALPTGGTLESHTLRLIFASHIIKILIFENPDVLRDCVETDANENTITILIKSFKEQNINVLDDVKEAAIPFLRCCVLFYHYLTEVPAPPAFFEVGGDTFTNMCAYLNLPEDINEIFVPEIVDVVHKWFRPEEVRMLVTKTGCLQVIGVPVKVSRLIDLPTNYSELIYTVSSYTCPKNGYAFARNPTMCLVCGEILCSESYCCGASVNKLWIGACNYHAQKCGAGIGIFLRVRDCQILLLASPQRGCFISAPYVDEYGETDEGFKRRNPLKLCHKRYQKLQRLWSNHGILEEIARNLETSFDFINFKIARWYHF